MFSIRKLTATVAIGACAAAGATQLPRAAGHDSAARLRNPASVRTAHAATVDAVTHTALEHTGATTTTHAMGLRVSSDFVSAQRFGATRNVGLPTSVDLRQYSVAIGDQGQHSSCVTWAISYGLIGWYSRHDGLSGAPFAPMFTYTQINGGVDQGSFPQDALNIAKTQGDDTHADYTQGDYDWQTPPTAAERANAAHYKISGYEQLFNGETGQGQAGVNAIANQLAAGKPVAIGTAVRNGFMHLSGTSVDTDTSSSISGYHEILAVGYDQQGLLIQNSWGPGWADHGFGRMGWNVVGSDVITAFTIDGLAFDGQNNNNNNKMTTTRTSP